MDRRACTLSCTADFSDSLCDHVLMQADLRISVKDYSRNKNLKVAVGARPVFAPAVLRPNE